MEGIKINKQKALGTVVYIVEGKKDEHNIFKNIFEKIFSIEPIKCRSLKTDLLKYKLTNNRDSQVFILNSKDSSIHSLDNLDYIKNMFHKINKELNIDIFNSAIYYIWDRDRESNSKEKIEEMIKKYYNSRDNEYELQGLLLLSYPSVESFMISCFEKPMPNEKIDNLKKYVKSNRYNADKIDDSKIEMAIKNFIESYRKILNKDFNITDIDLSMSDINKSLFDFEEKYYNTNKFYYYFSCIMISLFDLGVFEIED